MNYYVRRQPSAVVEGPFTAEELANRVREGRIPTGSLVSGSRDATAESLRHYRECDWAPVRDVPGLEELVPAPESKPVGRSRFARWTLVVCAIVGIAGNISLFVQNPQWRTGLLAVCLSWLLAHEIYQCLLEKGRIRRMDTVEP